MARKLKILVILTGGTIMMERSDKAGPLEPGSCTPLSELLSLFTPDFDFHYHSLFNLDSSNMQPEHWQTLARCIFERLADFDGFLILHGTDTMCYTAAALSFMLEGIRKPVIITGSQLPLRDPGSDGHNNVINSLLLTRKNPGGVFIVFGSQVIRGTRAKKVSSFDLQAFTSVNEEPIGVIGLSIRWREGIPGKAGKPKLRDKLDSRVALLKIHPGFSPELFDYCIKSGNKGIILESYGVGNVPDNFRSLPPMIRKATKQGTLIVIVSQCMVGITDLTIYEAGKEALEAGAISGYDMTPETALVKLMWTLGNFPENKVRIIMETPVRGELTPN
ncbi:MAG: asparaginase [Candidatus Wallbacteria bacterium]|nr:asparaginase [Candidatus Wallbacteria bacterium]